MRQFNIDGKNFNGYNYGPAILEKDNEGISLYSFISPVYKDPFGELYEYPDDSDYDGDDESWKDEPAAWWLFLYEADEPIEFTSEEEAKKVMLDEFDKKFTLFDFGDNFYNYYETEEDRLAREAEEAKKAKEAEERKQAFIDSWNEDERDFFKAQLRECGYNDTDEAVDSFRKRIEREYEDWYERNQWVKTWTNFLDGENIIGYIYGNL